MIFNWEPSLSSHADKDEEKVEHSSNPCLTHHWHQITYTSTVSSQQWQNQVFREALYLLLCCTMGFPAQENVSKLGLACADLWTYSSMQTQIFISASIFRTLHHPSRASSMRCSFFLVWMKMSTNIRLHCRLSILHPTNVQFNFRHAWRLAWWLAWRLAPCWLSTWPSFI